MKKLLLCLTMLLWGSQVLAAPYDLDSPIDNYTWGESQQQVYETLVLEMDRTDTMIGGSQALYLPPREDQNMHVFPFWQGKLVSINRLLGNTGNFAEASLVYERLLQQFTRLYGAPQAAQCYNRQAGCVALRWQATHETGIQLNKTTDKNIIYISYSYFSRRLYPGYEQEFIDYGPFTINTSIVAKALLPTGSEQQKAFIANRIRIANVQVIGTNPLLLQEGAYTVVCRFQDENDAARLSAGNEITISGLADKIDDNKTLYMNDVIITELLEDKGWRANLSESK